MQSSPRRVRRALPGGDDDAFSPLRLGYVAGDKPAGGASCIGGQAAVAHQIVSQLKAGSYGGEQHPAFGSVGLVGHSAGGLITEIEQGSYGDAEAIGVLGYSDRSLSEHQDAIGRTALAICRRGGQPTIPGRAVVGTGAGADGYALIGQTPAQGRRACFHSATAGAVRGPRRC